MGTYSALGVGHAAAIVACPDPPVLDSDSRLGDFERAARGPPLLQITPEFNSAEALDDVLGIQIAVGWCGESMERTKRLGWWNTDLVDPTGGGDFLARLLPRTHAWASLEAVREAARRTDEQGRRGMAEPDQLRTLYLLGFDVAERLAHRRARPWGVPSA